MDRYEAIMVTWPHPATQKLPLCRNCTQALADNTRLGDERSPQCLVTVITLSTETKYLWAQIALSYCEAHWGPACNQGLGLDHRSSQGLMPSPPPLFPHHKGMGCFVDIYKRIVWDLGKPTYVPFCRELDYEKYALFFQVGEVMTLPRLPPIHGLRLNESHHPGVDRRMFLGWMDECMFVCVRTA